MRTKLQPHRERECTGGTHSDMSAHRHACTYRARPNACTGACNCLNANAKQDRWADLAVPCIPQTLSNKLLPFVFLLQRRRL